MFGSVKLLDSISEEDMENMVYQSMIEMQKIEEEN